METRHTAYTAATARWAAIEGNKLQFHDSTDEPPYYQGAEKHPVDEARGRELVAFLAARDWQQAEDATWTRTKYPERYWTVIERPERHWETYRATEHTREVSMKSLYNRGAFRDWEVGSLAQWRGLDVKVVATRGGGRYLMAIVVLDCDEPRGYDWPPTMTIHFAALNPRPRVAAP